MKRELAVSRVKLRNIYVMNPQKIARKRFMMIYWCIWSGDEHTKSWPKSDHGKGPNFGAKQDGRQIV